jgi:hypothetical protein
MRNSLCRAAPAVMVLMLIMSARALAQTDVLVYSFETGGAFNPDGFVPNGATIAKSPGVGNTVGANSIHITTDLASATFVGTFTQNPLPAVLTDPNTTAIKMDVTLPAAYPGANSTIGITYFGYHDPDDVPGTGDETNFGTPFQANNASFQQMAGLAAGTHTLTVPLIEFFTNQPFNGPTLFNNPDPLADWDIGGFQLTFSKDDVAVLDVYVDNVRAVVVPEPASVMSLAGLGLLGLARRRR